MTRTAFRALFLHALNIAADHAAAKLAEPIPRAFVIELHGAGCPGHMVNVDEAISRMYLGEASFYPIIDVAITRILPGETVAFTRVSDHPPVDFDHTFDPSGLGPFKQIFAERVDDRRVHSG